MKYYLNALQKYTDFKGRSSRAEYWYFALFNLIICIVAIVADNQLNSIYAGVGLIYTLYSLFILIPSLAVSVRRLHDIGKTGFWVLIGVIPLLGAVILILFFIRKGEAGPNKYGESPITA